MDNQHGPSLVPRPAARERTWFGFILLLPLLLTTSGCGDDDEGPPSCNLEDPDCPGDLVCVPSDADPSRGVCREASPCEPDGDPCPGDLVCLPASLPGGQSLCINQCDVRDADDCQGDLTCDPIRVPCDEADPQCSALPEDRRWELRYACLMPVYFEGEVHDTSNQEAIEGARVVVRNDTGAVVTDVTLSDHDGRYRVMVPVARDGWGAPVETGFTLRADADDYLPFPHGIRVALPVDASTAVEDEDRWVVEDPTTQVGLIPLPEEWQGLARIEGRVLADDPQGVLVVAEDGDPPSPFGYSDRSGSYVIFNVAAGSATLRGYRQGLQLEPLVLTVPEDQDVTGADLEVADLPLGRISGSISIVNAPGAARTSVVLVPESTFNAALVQGEVPFGLRDPEPGVPPSLKTAYEIPNVPDGRYAVLAAFENDDLVRDPDEGIGGTEVVFVDLPDGEGNRELTLSGAFKITEALAVISPGSDGPEAVSTSQPDLVWADDSGEDYYELFVYDAFGNLVWDAPDVDRVTGDQTVTVQYGGSALETGMYYQFRATSYADSDAMSTTEVLRGVFFLAPE